MRKHIKLPVNQTILAFKPNKWNPELLEANIDGKIAASIQKTADGFDLYTDWRRETIFEGTLKSLESAIVRAQWRINLQ